MCAYVEIVFVRESVCVYRSRECVCARECVCVHIYRHSSVSVSMCAYMLRKCTCERVNICAYM